MSIYLNCFLFPSLKAECDFLYPKDRPFRVRRASFNKESFYPFGILADTGLERITFSDVTILYGGNGCGKTTALNVIAEKLGLARETLYNTGQFFPDYIQMCSYDAEIGEQPHDNCIFPVGSKIITSDDVFRAAMQKREFNYKRSEINEAAEQDYDDAVEKMEKNIDRIIARKNREKALRSKYVQEETERSNGEGAMLYFIDKMRDEALYILDEPENSLSIENQIELADYISATARFYKAQYIIATHSPFFASISRALIYSFEDGKVVNREWTELNGIRKMYDFFKEHASEFKETLAYDSIQTSLFNQ